jgi:hypothetical protein
LTQEETLKAALLFTSTLVVFFLGLVSRASLAADLVPPPLAGKATIIVYRPAKIPGVLLQAGGKSHLGYDEQWISALSKGEHFAFYAWPGLHKIESSIGVESEGAVELDVKAGATYYISAGPKRPTPISVVSSTGTAVALMDKETAEKELVGSKPVKWMQDLLQGTLAEVGTIGPLPSGAMQCGPAEWAPDVDSIKTSVFQRYVLLRGSLYVSDDALVLKFDSGSAAEKSPGVSIPIADIATVEIKNKMVRRVVLVTRKNGRLDSFTVISSGGGRIDRDKTQSCGDALASKVKH